MIIIEFLRKTGRCVQGARCFSRSSLMIYAHTYLQYWKTGISRAGNDWRPFHIFIWEILVPLTEWNWSYSLHQLRKTTVWYFLSSSSKSSLTIRCSKSRVPFLWQPSYFTKQENTIKLPLFQQRRMQNKN